MAGSASLCPKFHKAIELVGSRWTGAVLQILLAGRARFTDIRSAIPQISDRMLSERLHELETEGLVLRHVIPDTPVRVEYELTQKGRELQSSLTAVAKWAERWLPEAAAESAPARSVALSVGSSARKRGRKSRM
jgi:DNA-binding HxlR family transcriptional regulator